MPSSPVSKGKPVRLPQDLLLGETPVRARDLCDEGVLRVRVTDDYETLAAALPGWSEVLAIQTLLTAVKLADRLVVEWQAGIAKKALASPPIFPLLAVLLVLRDAEHVHDDATDGKGGNFDLTAARTAIHTHVLSRGFFVDSQIVLCADSLGKPTPRDLYDPKTRRLRSREDIETVVLDLLAGHQFRADLQSSFSKPKALAIIVAELFENTHLHGRLDLDRRPVGPNSVRGLVVKRMSLKLPPRRGTRDGSAGSTVAALELSIFDAGIGYFSSFTREALEPTTELKHEWKVLHNCLERHYNPEVPDQRSSHRGMGLNEVLRSLQSLGGSLEIRTGRLFAYRSFVEGEIQPQMQNDPSDWTPIRIWPKPVLLDTAKRYVAQPTEHEQLIGSSIRILVPLE